MNAAVQDQRPVWYRRLDDSRAQALIVLEEATLSSVIYPKTGWTVKDVLAHLTIWEVEVATSIHHFAQGKSYMIVNFRGRQPFNERMYLQYRDTPYAVIFSDWIAVRSGLKSAIRKTPVDRLTKPLSAPWEDQLTMEQLVESVITHESEHMAAIRRAIG
jgi:hypothetical protein